jgi:uncharacterized membrane protein YkoI
MNKFKMSLLAIALAIAVLGGGKLAIGDRLPWLSARANSAAKIDPALGNNETLAEAPETQRRSRITFQSALQIVEKAIGGKAYSIERETERDKPVIEIGIGEQEVFVDAESGKIVLIENLREKGDRDDIARSTEALKLQQLAPITVQEALAAGERFSGNQAHSIDLANQDGNLVYEVVAELQVVFIDAGNGKVLSTGAVGQANQNARPEVNSSIQIPSTHVD